MAFNKDQFRELISDVLKDAGLFSHAAVELLMLTCAVESNFGTYLKQVRGPARGVFQMEPTTEKDIWQNYLAYKDRTVSAVERYDTSDEHDLYWNLGYQIILARVHYLRVSQPLPNIHPNPTKQDVVALARYWKEHYNTVLGAGTIDKAIDKYYQYCV